jgi:hypothetical protein
MGFCLFNNLAVAVANALAADGVERALVVDWDVHHGNGTEAIFADSDRVLYASIHQSPLYPGTGAAGYAGEGDGVGYTVNLPVPPGSGSDEFLSLVQHVVVPIGRRFEPGLVAISAGYDAHVDDPLASCRVTDDGYVTMAGSVRALAEELGVPVLIHFQHDTYSTGFERFESILKAYPKVNFVGHAQTWWGNVSADLDSLEMYPKGPVKRGGLTDTLLAEYPNLYGDLSAGSGLNAITRDPDFGRDFVTRHWRKLIWGSDCDCHDGRGGGVSRGYCIAERSLAALRDYVTDRAKLRRILWENGAEVLRLKKG